jgi:putative heme transporter
MMSFMGEQPSPRRSQVTVRTVLTVGLGVLGILAVIEGITRCTYAISLTLAALLLALALDHAVQVLVRRGVRRTIAISIVVIVLLAALTGTAYMLIPPAVSQGKALLGQLPGFIRGMQRSPLFHRIDGYLNISERLQDLDSGPSSVISDAAKPVLSAVGGIMSFAAALVTIFILGVFMVIFGGAVIRSMLEELVVARRDVYETVLDKIYNSIGGYLAGLSLICGINATLTTTFLAIDRVPFFLPLGIVSGMSSMIPYAGPLVSGITISLLAFATGGAWHGLASIIYFLVYGQLEGNVLAPLIFRRTIRVDPLVVTLSVLFLGDIAGVAGAIVAVPAVAAVQIIVREVLVFRRNRPVLR